MLMISLSVSNCLTDFISGDLLQPVQGVSLTRSCFSMLLSPYGDLLAAQAILPAVIPCCLSQNFLCQLGGRSVSQFSISCLTYWRELWKLMRTTCSTEPSYCTIKIWMIICGWLSKMSWSGCVVLELTKLWPSNEVKLNK